MFLKKLPMRRTSTAQSEFLSLGALLAIRLLRLHATEGGRSGLRRAAEYTTLRRMRRSHAKD